MVNNLVEDSGKFLNNQLCVDGYKKLYKEKITNEDKKIINDNIESTGKFLKDQLCVDGYKKYYEDNRDDFESIGKDISNTVDAYIDHYTNEDNCQIF